VIKGTSSHAMQDSDPCIRASGTFSDRKSVRAETGHGSVRYSSRRNHPSQGLSHAHESLGFQLSSFCYRPESHRKFTSSLCGCGLAHQWTRHSHLTLFNHSRLDNRLILIAGKDFRKNIINIAIIANAPRITTHTQYHLRLIHQSRACTRLKNDHESSLHTIHSCKFRPHRTLKGYGNSRIFLKRLNELRTISSFRKRHLRR
jgi:hypothetical protein